MGTGAGGKNHFCHCSRGGYGSDERKGKGENYQNLFHGGPPVGSGPHLPVSSLPGPAQGLRDDRHVWALFPRFHLRAIKRSCCLHANSSTITFAQYVMTVTVAPAGFGKIH